MHSRYQELIYSWYSRSKRSRYLTLGLGMTIALCCEGAILLSQPIVQMDKQRIEQQNQGAILDRLREQIGEAREARILLEKYKKQLPTGLINPTTISAFQTYAMTLLQEQSKDLNIVSLDIQLKDCHQNRENNQLQYCDLFVQAQALQPAMSAFMRMIVTHPWFALIKETRVKIMPNNMLHTHLQLALYFQQPQKTSFNHYREIERYEPIEIDISNIVFNFFTPQELILETSSQADNSEQSLLDWRYDAVMKKSRTQFVHLSHKHGRDIWLHKGELLEDSMWHLQEISSDKLTFIHKESKAIVSINYSGEI